MDPVYSNLDLVVADLSIKAVYISATLLIFLSIISIKLKNARDLIKKILFFSFVFVAIGCTLFITGATVYLNVSSISKGPVHHHADYEIWRCGEELELGDPEGLSNKIGSNTVHEHNDKRIHIEGIIVEKQDASLGNFFRKIGGNLETGQLSFPGHHEKITLTTGDDCLYTQETQLQVFLYTVEGNNYSQKKLDDPRDYIISESQNIPPGDCIIIELDEIKRKTTKLCQSYETAIQTGDLQELKN